MTHPWFPPAIAPLTRLHARDGMLVDAACWQIAHAYHRERQSILFQSLFGGGIVRGLEVGAITAPETVPESYRDGRWLQVQPGIALDHQGNAIVVPEPFAFRLSSTVAAGRPPRPVYLVLRFVNPEHLQGNATEERLRETFRLEESSTPPQPGDIEVCRVLLPPDPVQLGPPADPFAPAAAAIDPRFRPTCRPRPEHAARVAIAGGDDDAICCWTRLFAAFAGLYPPLVGEVVQPLTTCPTAVADLDPYDLLHLDAGELAQLDRQQQRALQAFRKRGGTIWLELAPEGALEAQGSPQSERAAPPAADTAADPSARFAGEEVDADSADPPDADPERASARARDRHSGRARAIARQWDIDLQAWDALALDRPLRAQPFAFGALPHLERHLLHAWFGDGLLVTVGELSAVWGRTTAAPLQRETIRTAQELGTNILWTACRRRQLTRASAPGAPD